MSATSPQDQSALKRKIAAAAEEASAARVAEDAAWLKQAADQLGTVLRIADRFEQMVAR